jgi:cytochrome P450
MSKIEQFGQAESPFHANRMLFGWLTHDLRRVELYEELLHSKPAVLQFRSRAKLDQGSGKPPVFQQDVYLLTKRADVEAALKELSSAPYSALGSGTFMLGLDQGLAHKSQREYARGAFDFRPEIVEQLVAIASAIAAVLPFKQAEFDLAAFAEQAALRFVALLFGFPPASVPVLEVTMQKAYRALLNEIIGRHFVSEPGAGPEGHLAMGALLTHVAGLIDQIATVPGRLPSVAAMLKGTLLENEATVLERLARKPGDYSGNELAVIVVGSIAGIIGNVQASVCNAVSEFYRRGLDVTVAELARNNDRAKLAQYIMEALRLQPAAAFLPRSTKQDYKLPGSGVVLPANTQVLLAMGAATRDGLADPDKFDPTRPNDASLVFGHPSGDYYTHRCIGEHIGKPLITAIASRLFRLPGLSEALDQTSGEPIGLKKVWGTKCDSYPFRYARDVACTQQPLNVIMNIKTPVGEHAEALKKVIKYGAPLVERSLRDSKHVHFAWFVLLENDTKLALCTTYDGEFDAYLEHFASEVGDLFDKLFEHLQDPPPMPVKNHPKEFIATVRRYNARPVEGYFFSAYPQLSVSQIVPGAQ